jgi:CRP-like cAMP-binding protein
VIVHEGDKGSSMFVLQSGEAAVTLAGTDGEVARLTAGGFFGEISLLTGEPRTATVTAVSDCELVEVGVDAFRAVVIADPAILERVSGAVELRRAELERHRSTRSSAPESAAVPHSFLTRMRQWLRLSVS